METYAPGLKRVDRRRSGRWRVLRQLIACVILLVLFVGVYWTGGATASRGEVVLSQEVKRGTIEDTVTATGKILPRAYVDVGAQASGRIDNISVHVGDFVRQGELLLKIDPQVQAAQVDADKAELHELQANLAAQKAEAAFAEEQLQRNERLAPRNAISQSTLDEATRDAKVATAKVEAIQAEIEKTDSTVKSDQALLGYTSIYAPMSGTVTSIDVREGQTLNSTYSTPIVMRIADLSTMTVWTQVSEADVTRLHPGMDVWFTTLGHGDKRWTAKLRQILPAPQKPEKPSGQTASSPDTATPTNNVVLYTALFNVENHSGELLPEMTAEVSFVVAHKEDAVIAPMVALHSTPDAPEDAHVEVLEADGRRVERHITVGVKTRFEAQVLSGLEPGDRVVTGTRATKTRASFVGFRL